MPINTNVDGSVSGWLNPNKTMKSDLREAVALIDFGDLFRGPGTIAKYGNVRIDVQGQWSGPGGGRIGANIQAQVNRMSIAAIRVADTLGQAAGAVNQNAVVQAVQNALIASAGDGDWRDITGTSP